MKSLWLIVIITSVTLLAVASVPLPGGAAPPDGPGPRFGHSMVAIDGDVYLYGGMVPGNPNPDNVLWKYSSFANDWSAFFFQALIGRHSHSATVVNDKMYIYGGMDADQQPLSDLWVYDPATDSWSTLDTGGVPGRGYHSAAAVGDQIVIFGGLVSGGSPSSETWVYDTVASSWTQGQDFPDVGYADSAAAHQGKVYVLGHTQGQLYVYDLIQDTWTTLQAGGPDGAPSARVLAMSAQDNDTAWLLGGQDVTTGQVLGDVWSLDLATQTWTQGADLPEPLCNGAAALLGGGGQRQNAAAAGATQLLIFGGLDAQGQVSGETYIYQPTCQSPLSIALSGPPTTTVTIAATFTATVTPPTTTLPITYTWQATEQADVVHTGGGLSDTVDFTWNVTGTKTVTVTAVNGCGAVSGTHVIIITNEPPVADAGPDQSVQVNEAVTLDGSGSYDPDGHLPLAYGWTQTGGPSVTLDDETAVSPTFTAPATPAVLTFTLTVTDSFGLADPTPDEVVVTVEAVPLPVGGAIVPVNRLELLVPWLGLVALMMAAISAMVVRKRRGA